MLVERFSNINVLIDHINHSIESGDKDITKENVKQLIKNNRDLFFENPHCKMIAPCLRTLAEQLVCPTLDAGTVEYSKKLLNMASIIEHGKGGFVDVVQEWASADKKDWHEFETKSAKISLEKIEQLIDNHYSLWSSYNPSIGQSIRGLGERIKKEFPADEYAQRLAEKCFSIAELNVLPDEVVLEILHQVPPAKMGGIAVASQTFHQLVDVARIDGINKHKQRVCELGFKSAEEAVNYFTHPSRAKKIKYLDFTGMPIQNNDQLEKLLTSCPNMTALIIPGSAVSGDALKHLQHVPGLTMLDISACEKLELDALKHLKHVPELAILDISSSCRFEADALKHLEHIPHLTELNVPSACWLEADALKHLQHTPGLKGLDMSYCTQLAPDALKHLQHTSMLAMLNIDSCKKLEPDALKNLLHVPGLITLDISCCTQLAPDALEHLQHVPALTTLVLFGCTQLESSARENLQHTSKKILF